MATPFVRGAVHTFVGLKSGGSARFSYLGTCRTSPRWSLRPHWKPIPNDIAGEQPLAVQWLGEEAVIGCALTRWNEGVYAALAARPLSLTAATGTTGAIGKSYMGSAAQVEGLDFALVLVFPYGGGLPGFAKPVYVANGMPAGLTFTSAVLLGPDEHEGGTRHAEMSLTFHCIPFYNPSDGSFSLYTRNVPAGLRID